MKASDNSLGHNSLAASDWRQFQAMQDFNQALSAIIFLQEAPSSANLEERRRLRAYHDSAIISYSRPFTASRGLDGLPKLSVKQIGIKMSESERALHDWLISLRNEVVAHTDSDRMRLLVTSFDVEGIALPHVVADESYPLLGRLDETHQWVYKLAHALARTTFHRLQQFPAGTKHLKDHLYPPDGQY